MGDIIARHRIQYDYYADDTHIYMTVERDESIVPALSKVEIYVADVADWMERNQMKLNKEKSEAIIFLTEKQRVGITRRSVIDNSWTPRYTNVVCAQSTICVHSATNGLTPMSCRIFYIWR